METEMPDDRTAMHPYCPFIRTEWEHRLDGLAALLDAKIDPVSDGITGIHARLDKLNGRVGLHDAQIVQLQTWAKLAGAAIVPLIGVVMWLVDKAWK